MWTYDFSCHNPPIGKINIHTKNQSDITDDYNIGWIIIGSAALAISIQFS